MIAARREPLAGFAGQRPRSAGMVDLVRENPARERLRCAVGAFEHDDAEIAEHPIEHARERVGHADAGRVGASQIREQFGCELGLRQRRRELVDAPQ